jgi:hypothetical protein
MEIISYLHAATVLKATWDEIRPQTGAVFPATVQLVRERYQFQQSGQSPTAQQVGIIAPNFQVGQFKMGEALVSITQLEFQPAGILAACSTTEQTLALLDDLFKFLHEKLAYRLPSKERERQYTTTIIAKFKSSISPLFEPWEKILSALNELAKPGHKIVPYGVRFFGEIGDHQPDPERYFGFERRVGAPPGEEWFFSQAPIQTKDHVRLLETIESALGR